MWPRMNTLLRLALAMSLTVGNAGPSVIEHCHIRGDRPHTHGRLPFDPHDVSLGDDHDHDHDDTAAACPSISMGSVDCHRHWSWFGFDLSWPVPQNADDDDD